ncbi:MAG: hypothetical protein F4Y07_10160 [Gemmatimonadetes bacterium]|nr:hypothetical protein [Gemmatimonadota bacterium]MXX56312.1 hypothetical protein [Gemmatimonadota bacterium]MXX70868.1 hypothetical protein [Gemmatimonadota bacterium]MYB07485.1 hypothetical protein [Gemmatimonadota bacterium]MYC92814.1 hypothetical protein [Gemmatimonadota bacterium]
MPALTLHYNAACPDCVRQASRTARVDWFGRVAFSTEPSPLGDVPVGEIVVVDRRRKQLFTGVFATRRVCMEVPLFVPLGLLLYVPPILRLVGSRNPGCNGDTCDV